jgi:hypothetical protein
MYAMGKQCKVEATECAVLYGFLVRTSDSLLV